MRSPSGNVSPSIKQMALIYLKKKSIIVLLLYSLISFHEPFCFLDLFSKGYKIFCPLLSSYLNLVQEILQHLSL